MCRLIIDDRELPPFQRVKFKPTTLRFYNSNKSQNVKSNN